MILFLFHDLIQVTTLNVHLKYDQSCVQQNAESNTGNHITCKNNINKQINNSVILSIRHVTKLFNEHDLYD